MAILPLLLVILTMVVKFWCKNSEKMMKINEKNKNGEESKFFFLKTRVKMRLTRILHRQPPKLDITFRGIKSTLKRSRG